MGPLLDYAALSLRDITSHHPNFSIARKGHPLSELTTIKDLLESEIKDLYSAENQLTKAIPKMANGTNNEALSAAFEAHLKETEGQIARLEVVAKLLDTTPTGKKCKGMEGVIAEGAEALEEKGNENVLDLGIIGAGSRVEHYEMAGYTTAINLAKQLGDNEIVSLLGKTLAEEQAADEKLRKIGQQLLTQAPAAEPSEGHSKKVTARKN
jgi:ferritin-like metal-binding protein YciE